jgi:SEC-C motif-containing protein
MASSDLCPCGSGAAYKTCCAPYHKGEREAPDAESMMRSRYAAYAKREIAYLIKTLDAAHEDRKVPEAELQGLLAAAARNQRYMGLTILDHRGPNAAGIAEVLFLAKVFERGRDFSFVERSEFTHDGTGWRYRRGEPVPVAKIPGDLRALTLATFTGP